MYEIEIKTRDGTTLNIFKILDKRPTVREAVGFIEEEFGNKNIYHYQTLSIKYIDVAFD
jgi:hypothetical protein